MNRPFRLAYSTCPNDTFVFYALAHGKIDCGLSFDIELEDVETLNLRAGKGIYDVTKLSFAALGLLRDGYALLKSGAAIGRGCGPLIVTRPGFDPLRLPGIPIAVPGLMTTACMLLGIYLSRKPDAVPMVFDEIMPAVARGRFEAGVIIHEGRFTFERYGLTCLADLGEFWENRTGMPIPLGGIAVSRDLPLDMAKRVETAIRDSVIYAHAHFEDAEAYIRSHAKEMEPEVIRRHIELYVNDFTPDMGEEGRIAVEYLFRTAVRYGLLPESLQPLFME